VTRRTECCARADASRFLEETRKISGEAIGENIFIKGGNRPEARQLGKI
jgi:hypothetical protein